jgi:acyl-coenzyme A thioesterase PaaI-like protein
MDVSIKKMRWLLFLLGFMKIPMIRYTKPKLLAIDDNTVRVKIKLRRRTKNHLNSMYFGALSVGADIAGGIQVFYFSKKMDRKVSFAFKGMNAQFLKRAESDIVFESNEGQKIQKAMEKSLIEGSRINDSIMVEAKNDSGEIVATFEMIVSVRVS